jgi:deferrochelatase/peroxidase EfeB
MGPQVKSRHLRNASELLLFAPIKTGFVPNTEILVSYVSRLTTVLDSLFEPVRAYIEHLDIIPSGNAIEALRTIYSVQYTVVEQPARSQLIVAVSFDSSWEAYMQRLVDKVGNLLDVIFLHCEGYDRPRCREGYEPFSEWIYQRQAQCNLFYNATPDLTTDDLRYLRLLSRRKLTAGEGMQPLEEEAAREASATSRPDERRKVLAKLAQGAFGLSDWFPESEAGLFDDAAKQLLVTYLQRGDAEALAASLPPRVVQWLQALLGAPTAPQPLQLEPPRLPNEALKNIQGNIIKPYDSARYGAVVLVQCNDGDALRRLLEAMRTKVTSALSSSDELRINLALTYGALTRLGLSESTLMSFPKEFREGMEARAGLLGDIGPNTPERWESLEVGVRATATLSAVDVVLLLQKAVLKNGTADDSGWDSHHPLFDEVRNLAEELGPSGTRIIHVQPLRRYPNYDHFGVADGTSESQPVPRAILGDEERDSTAGAPERDRIALGELLLGYRDSRGKVARCAELPPAADILKDGTFLVIRKLKQDTEDFQSYVRDCANELDKGEDELKKREDHVRALLVGRTPEGKPLANLEANDNDFDYRSGNCPLYAHIRRANPRDDDPRRQDRVPRIMRRSFPYGPQASNGAEQGLVFLGYGARIAQQFEVIQRWINGGNSTAILSSQNDLVSGVPQPAGGTYPVANGSPHPALPPPVQTFVTLRWGLYLFVPSIRALAALSQPSAVPERAVSLPGDPGAPSPLVVRGEGICRELDAIQDPDAARTAWKQYIEDPHFADDAAALWAAIRRSGEPKRTPYGVLVADARNAARVLSDQGSQFSVREYWRRLHDKLGQHYLTLDPVPGKAAHPSESDGQYEQGLKGGQTYADLATAPNEYICKINARDAYKRARAYASEAIGVDAAANLGTVDLRVVAKTVVARLAQDWIGMPCEASDSVKLLEHYIILSRYAFQLYPEASLEDRAKTSAKALKTAYQSRAKLNEVGEMAKYLIAKGYKDQNAVIVACAGAIVGFAAPAVAATVGVLGRLLESGQFARLALSASALPEQLLPVVLEELRRRPVPPLLYRRVISGNLGRPGDLVVVGLQAVVDDFETVGATSPSGGSSPAGEAWSWLFGGPHGGDEKGKPPHGCPARDPAVNTIAGIVRGFLDYPDLERNGLFTVSLGNDRPQALGAPGERASPSPTARSTQAP